jgi:hypothetical protein
MQLRSAEDDPMATTLTRPAHHLPLLALAVLLALVMTLFFALDGHKPPPELDRTGSGVR